MNPNKRIALEILAPAPLGLLGLTILAMIREIGRNGTLTIRSQDFMVITSYLLVACVVGAIPSVIYSLLMEWIFRVGVSSASWWAVTISSVLGGLAGAAIMLVLCWFRIDGEALVTFGAVGFAVGFAIGVLIKRWSPRSDPSRPAATP